MENYQLKSNEVILFKGIVNDLQDNKKKIQKELILTNLNIVLVTTIKKLFKTEVVMEEYKVEDIKTYNGTSQVIRKGASVDVYLLSCEKFLQFDKIKQAKEFTQAALRVASGYSKFVRGVKKVQQTVQETNEALDIDIVDIAKKTAIVTGSVAIELAASSDAGKKTKMFGKIANALLHPKTKQLKAQDDGILIETKPEND